MDLDALARFIVAAKRATYIGDGRRTTPSRSGAQDLVFEQGPYAYRDSYFGGTDFLGQEVVWLDGTPVWAMNYYGCVTRPDLIDGPRSAAILKAALSEMYAEGRFLGGYRWTGPTGSYVDRSEGDVAHFHGREHIEVGGTEAYALDYFGGLIKP